MGTKLDGEGMTDRKSLIRKIILRLTSFDYSAEQLRRIKLITEESYEVKANGNERSYREGF